MLSRFVVSGWDTFWERRAPPLMTITTKLSWATSSSHTHTLIASSGSMWITPREPRKHIVKLCLRFEDRDPMRRSRCLEFENATFIQSQTLGIFSILFCANRAQSSLVFSWEYQ
mmetsp:Transcript_43369/g.67660  ORF Transcript_43369/g.67660 Transcript_43369/m.67660 type:complete len:114 (+) Transcript_43369:101-442(+)